MNQSKNVVVRNIKVSTAFKSRGNNFNKRFVAISKIILQGNYLQAANFNPADSLEVLLRNKVIVIKRV